VVLDVQPQSARMGTFYLDQSVRSECEDLMPRAPKHSEGGKAWPKDAQTKRKAPLLLNRNTRRLMEQVEGMADSTAKRRQQPSRGKR
jgi:hypothetical protein